MTTPAEPQHQSAPKSGEPPIVTDTLDPTAAPVESTVQAERAVTSERTVIPEPLMSGEVAAASVRKGMPAVSDRANQIVDAWLQAEPEPEPEIQLPELSRWQMMEHMATRIARSAIIPDKFKNRPDDILMVLLQAHDLGLTTSMALAEIKVIDGIPSKSAYLLRYLVRREGHKLWTDIEKNQHGKAVAAVARGVRKDDPTVTRDVRYTIDDAETAGLCKVNDDGSVTARSGTGKRLPWELHTEDMLVARATSRLCRRMFEDAVGGSAYIPEELGFVEGEGEEVEPSKGPPAPVPLDAVTVAQLQRRLDQLTPELREEVRAAWKKQRFPAVDRLLTSHWEPINAIIEHREKRMPEDAHVVADESESTAAVERAASVEGTGDSERESAVLGERTVVRAEAHESTDAQERADEEESTAVNEQAVRAERTEVSEQAADHERATSGERTAERECEECGAPAGAPHQPECMSRPF